MEWIVSILALVVLLGFIQSFINDAEREEQKDEVPKLEQERIEVVGGIQVKVGPVRTTRSKTFGTMHRNNGDAA